MIEYLLKSSICLILFYLFFVVFMRRDTHFLLNRYYLIGSLLLSLILPLSNIDHISFVTSLPEVYNNESSEFTDYKIIDEAVAGYQEKLSGSISKSEFFLNDLGLVRILYGIISILFGIKFLFAVVSLYNLYNKSRTICSEHYIVVISKSIKAPFSFFKWIFVNRYRSDCKADNAVLQHEIAHSKQLHSIDIVLSEIYSIVFWFNPIIHLLKREIKVNHEYLADDRTLRAGINMREYQHYLLKGPYQKTDILFASSNDFSHIGKRFKMMKRQRSHGFSQLKVILSLPIIMMLLVGFANADVEDSLNMANIERSLNIKIVENPDSPPKLVKTPKLTMDNCKDILPESVTNAPEDINLQAKIIIGMDGTVLHVEILEEKPLGYNAGSFAIEFFKRCTYEPAIKDGKVVVAALEDILILK